MAYTVIGIFDSASEAQTALQQLVSSGVSRTSIDISSQNATDAEVGRTTGAYDQNTGNSAGDKVGSFFSSLFGGSDNDESRSYSTVARRSTVVTVHAQSREEAERTADLLDQYGAVNVNERAGQYGYTGSTNTATSTADAAAAGSIPVIEENLAVGKRTVETGGVRLRSRIVERPVEEHLRLREEHVNVERNPVNRPVTDADLAAFKETTIEMTEHAEVPVVAKEARVVEEIRIEKDVDEREEVIRDTVRRTDVEVENLSDAGTLSTGADVTGMAAGVGAGVTGMAAGADSAFLDRSNQQWTGSSLRRMKEVEDDYEVADDDEDVRGWDVVSQNGEKIGEVEELIVDMNAMRVRYLDVELDDDALNLEDDRHVLIPVGMANLDHGNNNVVVPSLTAANVMQLPAYQGDSITRDYENRVMAVFSPSYQASATPDHLFYEGEHFDTNRFYGARRGSTE